MVKCLAGAAGAVYDRPMASEFARVRVVSRGDGKSSVGSAAYRAGEDLTDGRTGRTYHYSHRAAGVAHAEIILPAGAPPEWYDRSTLWNAVERAEDGSTRRATAQVAKDHVVALPVELPLAQQIELVREFAREIFVAHGVGVDFAVHLHSDGNPHAHILTTTRVITRDGFGRKARHLNGQFARGRKVADAHQLRHDWAAFQTRWASDRGIELTVTNNNGEWQPEAHRGPSASVPGEDEPVPVRLDQLQATEDGKALRRSAILSDPNRILERLSAVKTVFTDRDLRMEIARHLEDFTDIEATVQRCLEHEELVSLGRLAIDDPASRVAATKVEHFTTLTVIEREMRLERLGRKLLDRHHKAGDVLSARDQDSLAQRFAWLSEEQRAALGHVLDPHARIRIVVGWAGAGKSRMLGAARESFEGAGLKVRGLALAGRAAESLQDASGIASSTVHGLLGRIERGQEVLDERSVLVLDEAGMVHSALMLRLLEVVETSGAKLILVGDPEQLQPIQAGNPLRLMAGLGGYAELTAVRRQEAGWQRAATRELALGEVMRAVDRYRQAGDVVFAESHDDAKTELVNRYLRVCPERNGESVVVLAHARRDVAELNEKIRERLMADGRLGTSRRYRLADVTNFVGELRPGVQCDFAVGDRVLFGRNDANLGVRNGSLGTVETLGESGIGVRLDSGVRVDVDLGQYGDLSHGYAMTIHKSQGVTVDHTLALANYSWNRNLTYVAMSRHRKSLTLFIGRDKIRDEESLRHAFNREASQVPLMQFLERHGLEISTGREIEALDDSDLAKRVGRLRIEAEKRVSEATAELEKRFEEELRRIRARSLAARQALAAHRASEPKGVLRVVRRRRWAARLEELEGEAAEAEGEVGTFLASIGSDEERRRRVHAQASRAALPLQLKIADFERVLRTRSAAHMRDRSTGRTPGQDGGRDGARGR